MLELLFEHASVLHRVLSTFLCSDAGAVVCMHGHVSVGC